MDDFLLPYGQKIFKIENLSPRLSYFLSVKFIAIKQGLQKYPKIRVQSSRYSSYDYDFEDGVFATGNL